MKKGEPGRLTWDELWAPARAMWTACNIQWETEFGWEPYPARVLKDTEEAE